MQDEIFFQERQRVGFFMQLETHIRQDGVCVRFSPLNWKFKQHGWDTIAQAYVRTYNPVGEYGGWGYRYSFRNGKAYNITGNQGIQLVFKDGSKLLVGTQQPKEASTALQEAGYLNPNDLM
jgi:hypothetical protein